MKLKIAAVAVLALAAGSVGAWQSQEYKSGIPWSEPAKVEGAAVTTPPPSDAIVLFDGSGLDAWDGGQWVINDDGSMTPRRGAIRTKQSFGDVQLHVEWMTPEGEEGRSGQGKGNSGVFLMEKFEVQILDSFENTTYFDGQAGALYKQSPPLVNASRAPGEWQSYDILFEAPHFDEGGKLEEPAYITVLHNGVVIQNRWALKGNTDFNRPPAYHDTEMTGRISLQDHGNPLRFRNIWVRELKLSDAERQEGDAAGSPSTMPAR